MSPRARVLVVDDDSGARTALTELLREEGYEVYGAADGFKALGRLEQWTPEIVLSDLKMPGMDGLELMAKLRQQLPSISVIVMTAFGSIESAVDAVHRGADDYLTKPLQLPNLLLVLNRVVDLRNLRGETDRLRAALHQSQLDLQVRGGGDHNLVGEAKAFRGLLDMTRQVAQSDAPVLISGGQGSGKRAIGHTLHRWSYRQHGPFVAVDCNAADPRMLERELFGEFGLGNNPGQSGKLGIAAEGTIYFDEIAYLPLQTQGRLLQCLSSGQFQPEGGGPPQAMQARVIASSAQDLMAAVREGRFREELYYRIKVITLDVPGLRERRDDIPLLAAHFLRNQVSGHPQAVRGLSARALGTLMSYEWPGNIRELRNVIEHAAAVCRSPEIEPRDLPRELFQERDPGDDRMPQVPGASLAELERFAILRTLEHVGGSTSKAAEILGISPRKIQYRLNDYRIGGTPETGSAKSS